MFQGYQGQTDNQFDNKKKVNYKPDSWSSHKTHSFDMNEMDNTWKNATYSYNSTEVFITLFCLNYFKYFVWIISSMQERNPLDCVRLSFDWVRHSIEHNPMNWVRLGSICSIKFDWFGNQTHTVRCAISFDCRNQSNSIHGLSLTELDWVRFPKVRLTMPGLLCHS